MSVMRSIWPMLILILSTSILAAGTIEAEYSVEFGIVGEVGRARAALTTDERYYMIEANVTALGIAKTVTDDLKERHISKGHLENGLLVTDMYQMIKSYGIYTSTTIYRVDHKTKRLTRQYRQWKYDRLMTDETDTLAYYSKDDMLTLFLNLPKHIKEKHTPRKYRFKAVGADRKNGRVDVTIPSPLLLKKMERLVGKGKEGSWYAKVVMHRKLYHSRQGELDVRMGKEGLVDKAVLKDLIYFGDVRIIRQ